MKNLYFLEKAEKLRPKLLETQTVIECNRQLSKGDTVLYDFGNHFVGFLSFDFSQVGAYPDAPLQLDLTFYESREEFGEDPEKIDGWMAGSWVQQERIHIDDVPGLRGCPS